MTSFGCWYVHFPLPIVVSNLFFFVMARWGAILMPLIWLLWQVEFVIGFVLLGFQVGVAISLGLHNFDLEPHFDAFLAH